MELAEALGTDHVPGWNALLARVRGLAERDRNSKAALLHAMKRTDSPAWSYLMERVAERFSTTEDQRTMVAVEARETAIRDEIHAALGSPEGANRSRAELVLAVQEVAALAAGADLRCKRSDEMRDQLAQVLRSVTSASLKSEGDLVAATYEAVTELRRLRRSPVESVSDDECTICDGAICEACSQCHRCERVTRNECPRGLDWLGGEDGMTFGEMRAMERGLSEVIQSLTTAMVTDPRDWSLGKVDSWLYAVIVGWDLEGVDADVADRHNWNHDVRLRLAKLHAAVMAASRGRQ